MKEKKTEREILTEELLNSLQRLTVDEIKLLIRIAINMVA